MSTSERAVFDSNYWEWVDNADAAYATGQREYGALYQGNNSAGGFVLPEYMTRQVYPEGISEEYSPHDPSLGVDQV